MCTSRHRETLRTVIISLNITNLLAFIMDKTWDGNYCSKLYKPTDPTNQEEGRINLHLRVTQHEARLRNPYCREAKVLHIMSVCLEPYYPARKAHGPYCIFIWGLPGSAIFFHILIYGTILGGGKKILNIKCVWIFSTTFVSHASHSKKNRARYDSKCKLVFK